MPGDYPLVALRQIERPKLCATLKTDIDSQGHHVFRRREVCIAGDQSSHFFTEEPAQ